MILGVTATATATAIALAVLTPVFATFGVDPAWAGILNFAILVYMAVFTRREITTLRRQSVAAAEAAAEASAAAAAASVTAAAELARTAKGSEMRAEKAAAEITETKRKVEAAAAQVVVLVRAVRDELRHLHGEWDRLGDARHEHDARHDAEHDEMTPPGADR